MRDSSGNPTGIFIDNAMYLVSQYLPPVSDAKLYKQIQLAIQECNKYGVTCIHDAGSNNQVSFYLT